MTTIEKIKGQSIYKNGNIVLKYVCSVCIMITVIISLRNMFSSTRRLFIDVRCYNCKKGFLVWCLCFLMLLFLVLSLIITNEKMLFVIGIVLVGLNIFYFMLFKKPTGKIFLESRFDFVLLSGEFITSIVGVFILIFIMYFIYSIFKYFYKKDVIFVKRYNNLESYVCLFICILFTCLYAIYGIFYT